MIGPTAQLDMVAVAEPKHVNGLRLVVHPETGSEGGQMRLGGSNANPEGARRGRLASPPNVGTQDLQLPVGRQRSSRRTGLRRRHEVARLPRPTLNVNGGKPFTVAHPKVVTPIGASEALAMP